MTKTGRSPKVSVVIIFLNPGDFISEAIGSVFVQSFRDWELVLVDDGSTDQSSALAIAAAAERPGQVRILDHPGHVNRGTSASRNLGLLAARGEYVLFLDADDVLFVRALERLVELAEANPSLDAIFATTLWWSWAPEFADRKDAVQSYGPYVGRQAPPRLLRAMIFDEYLHPATCSSLIRRDAMQAVGGFEPEFPGMYEDTVLLAKLLLKHAALLTDECVSAYRMHPSSQCHKAAAEGSFHRSRPNPDRGRYLRWLRGHLQKMRRSDALLHLVLARELWAYDRPRLFRIANSYKLQAAVKFLRRLGKSERSEVDGAPLHTLAVAQQGLQAALIALKADPG